jgi:hypothetical protein
MRALSNLFELMRQRITRQAVSTQQKLTSLISRGKRSNGEPQSMSNYILCFMEKITPYFQTSYLLHLLSILNEHFQITEFLNMCVMQHWPLIYPVSSCPLSNLTPMMHQVELYIHLSSKRKGSMCKDLKLSELLSVWWLDQYALYHFPMEMRVWPNSCICPLF